MKKTILLIALMLTIVGISNISHAEVSTYRVEGPTRYETSLESAIEANKNTKTITVVTGRNFPDALSASGMTQGLVVFANERAHAQNILKNLPYVNNVFILGSESVVSKDVENVFKNAGKSVRRVAGSSRYDTSLEFAKLARLGSNPHVILVTGENYPDGVAASNLTLTRGASPVLLTKKDSVPANTLNFLRGIKNLKVTILGTENVVSRNVENQLSKFATVKRYGGDTRYHTATKVAELYNSEKVIVATGEKYPDALSAANLVYHKKAPLVFTQGGQLNSYTKAYLNNRQISSAVILGSNSVISKNVETEISAKRSISDPRHSVMKNFSVYIEGSPIPISNENTQARLDEKNLEYVNWGADWVTSKNNGDGKSLYLTSHRGTSPGDKSAVAKEILFKDSSGNVSTYVLKTVHGPFPKSPKANPRQIELITGKAGDVIAFQTCDYGVTDYRVYEFHLKR